MANASTTLIILINKCLYY